MAEETDLQFDRAEYDRAPSPASCSACQAPLYSSYYEVNGQTVCEGCCHTLRDSSASGSSAGRAVRATAAGVGAGLAGAFLYWAILAVSGYEFALIAIVVGYAVGKAVHWGARGLGGWGYQTLAIVLTYLAIVSAYVPMIVTELMKQQTAAAATAGPDGAARTAADAAPASALGSAEPAGLAVFLLALAALLLIACVAPFAAGLENVVGLIIIGIGMYQAWKINRHQPLVITGPHVLAAPATATIAP